MSKYGKVIIIKDDVTYEISEKIFFKRGRPELYYMNGNMGGVGIVINRSVSNIEFIDCNFIPLNKRKKKYFTLTSNCPIKMINANFEKLIDITIATSLNNVVIKNVQNKDDARLIIQQSGEVLISDIQDLDLDIIAEKIDISNYTSTLDNNAVVLLADNISLKNVMIKNIDTVRITAKAILSWIHTKIAAKNLFIENLFDSSKLKNSSSSYMLDDEKVNKLVAKKHLYTVLKRLNNMTQIKKRNILESRQEELKNTIDVEIEKLRKQIEELENYKASSLSQIENGMNQQKISSYVKSKNREKNKNTK